VRRGGIVYLPDSLILLPDLEATALLSLGAIDGPVKEPDGESDASEQNTSLTTVNLNTATVEQLVSIKYIGEKIAQKIVDARPIADLEDGRVKAGLPPKTWAEISASLEI
jgi:DNA uptake protein ComE-like DNA-binding protein